MKQNVCVKNPIDESDLTQVASDILAKAKQKGASAAEVGTSIGKGFSAQVRMGETDKIEYTHDKSIAITVYFGQRKGSASTTDTSPAALSSAIDAACAIAEFTQEDSCAGLADASLLATEVVDCDLYTPWALSVDDAIRLAIESEARGLGVDKRINNSEGVCVDTYQSYGVYANSNGFIGATPRTRHAISAALVATDSSGMEQEYDYTVSRDPADLLQGQVIAERCAARAIARLGAQQLPTCKVPVVFEAPVASSLIGHFIGAISGSSLYRKSSFLLDSLGQKIFPDFLQMEEHPLIKKGMGSGSFDGDGVATVDHAIVRDGVVESYVLSCYSARKLGLQTTGNAGGVRNLAVSSGEQDLAGLLKTMDKGLLVTDLMGQGINLVTGDYSRGASGFWVEQGVIQYPVHEITIAGNLRDMFGAIVAVSNDVDRRKNVLSGSILVEQMMVAGG